MKKSLKNFIKVAGGGAVGFVNGFFGGGGGMLLVPLLERLEVKTKRAHATAILLILPMCLASAITYTAGGAMDWAKAGYISIGVVAGGIVGALLLKKLNPTVVGIIFSLLMLAVGIKMCI